MSAVELLAVAIVGGAGAMARFALGGVVAGWVGDQPFPFGTLAVNLLGCFGLGVVSEVALAGAGREVVETGLIGAFTTFSTWVLETHRLAEERQVQLAVANVVVSLVLGGAAAWIGQMLGARL